MVLGALSTMGVALVAAASALGGTIVAQIGSAVTSWFDRKHDRSERAADRRAEQLRREHDDRARAYQDLYAILIMMRSWYDANIDAIDGVEIPPDAAIWNVPVNYSTETVEALGAAYPFVTEAVFGLVDEAMTVWARQSPQGERDRATLVAESEQFRGCMRKIRQQMHRELVATS
jgi:hypothetical protein